MIHNNEYLVFLELLRAGLWEKEARLSQYEKIDYNEVYRLAEEQSVVGLVAAGLEHIADIKPPKNVILSFVGLTLQLEQRNIAMNSFISNLVNKMRNEGVDTLLVKGQGIAQCYERPLWRASGDVDFLLSEENYKKAKTYLYLLASEIDQEPNNEKHLQMVIDSWSVELHGNLPCHLSNRAERVINTAIDDSLYKGNVRLWDNNGVGISLPNVDNDIILIFTHILKHFFYGGIGLRQICDWCRLLWTYKDSLNHGLLESRIRKMGLMSEWTAFAAVAVDWLGMPAEAMPLYLSSKRYNNASKKVLERVFETGNFGHNIDDSYQSRLPFFMRKTVSLWRHVSDSANIFFIFPLNSIVALRNNIVWGVKDVLR